MSLHRDSIIEKKHVSDYGQINKPVKIKLNVYTLNQRLNENKKKDFLRNFKLITISLTGLAIIMLISFKF